MHPVFLVCRSADLVFVGVDLAGAFDFEVSGENVFRMAGMCSDEGLMEAAFEDARAVYDGGAVSDSERDVLLTYARAMYDVGSAALN